MKKKFFLIAVPLIVLSFTAQAVIAQQAADPKVALGIGPALVPEYEGSTSYELFVFPYVNVEWATGQYIRLKGQALRANLIPDSNLKAGPVIQFRRGRDDVNNDRVDRMGDIDSTVEMGAFFGMEIENWHASIQGVLDVADEHDGALLRFDVGYTFQVNDTLKLPISVFTTYADDDYMETYFSVDLRDSNRSGLRLYDADGDMKDVGINLGAHYFGWEKWSLFGLLGYTRLTGDAEDSPIVDDVGDENQYLIGIAAIYHF